MSDYSVNVKYNVDSSGLRSAASEADKLSGKLKNAGQSAIPLGRNLNDSLGKVRGLAGLASGGIGGLETALLRATTVAAGLAASIIVVVGAMAKLSYDNLKTIHEISEMAEVTGIAATELAKFGAVAAREGITLNDFGTLLNKMSRSIEDAVEDNKKLADTYTKLGLSTRELKKDSPDKQFLKIFDAIQKISNQGEKVDAVFSIFGKGAIDILKTATSAEDFKNKMAEAGRTGEAASKNLLEQADKQDKALKNLASQWQTTKNRITEIFAPAITGGLQMIIGLIDGQSGAWDRAFSRASVTYNLYRNMAKTLFGGGGTTPYDQRPGAVPMSGYITGREPKPVEPKPEPPINNETEAERAAKAASAAAGARAEADRRAAEATRKASEALQKFQSVVEETSKMRNDTRAEQLKILSEFGARSYALNNQPASATPVVDAMRLGESFDRLYSILNQNGFKSGGYEMKTAGRSSIVSPTGIAPTDAFLADLKTKIPDATKMTEELEKRIKAIQELLTTTGIQILDEKQFNVLTAVEGVMGDINDELTAQSAIATAIANGQITSQDELNRFTAIQGRILSITNQLKNEGIALTKEETAELEKQLSKLEGIRKGGEKKMEENVEQANVMKGIASGFVDTFVDGLATGKIKFKEFLAQMAIDLLKSQVLKLISQYGGAITSIFTGTPTTGTTTTPNAIGPYQANGGAWLNGVQMFAKGGVVNGATMFGHAGGTGMMGEAGPEAIMPLTRGPNGKLGVSSHGGGGTTVYNMGNTTINVQSTADAARDDRETARAIDKMMTEKFHKLLAEQRRSGNSLNPMFGNFRY